MTIEQIQRLHHAQPFRPFRIYMVDGRSVVVPQPAFLAHPGGGHTIVAFTGDDQFEIIDLRLVVSLEVDDGKSAAPTKKRR